MSLLLYKNLKQAFNMENISPLCNLETPVRIKQFSWMKGRPEASVRVRGRAVEKEQKKVELEIRSRGCVFTSE